MSKKKRSHGGKRKGAGRKPKYEESTIRKLVTIPVSLVDWSESKYESFSAAVVEALQKLKEKE